MMKKIGLLASLASMFGLSSDPSEEEMAQVDREAQELADEQRERQGVPSFAAPYRPPFLRSRRRGGKHTDPQALTGEARVLHDITRLKQAAVKRSRQASFRAVQHKLHHASMLAAF